MLTAQASYKSNITDYELGTRMYRELQGAGFIDSDLVVEEYISFLKTNLNYSSVGTIPHLNLFVVRDKEINAFAFFGNNIGIHQGLLTALPSENELAAVVAHEMAHIHLKHLDRFKEQQNKLLPASIFGIIGAIAIGSPELATAALANHYHQTLAFSRSNEQEADRIGMQILSSCRFDPYSMASAFQLLQEKNNLNYSVQEFLSSHPLYNSRISEAEASAIRLPYAQHANNFMYEVSKARIEVALTRDIHRYINILEQLNREHKYNNKNIFLYKTALAYAQNRQYLKSIEILTNLTNNNYHWVYALALAEVNLKNNSSTVANQLLDTLNNNHPDHFSIIYALAQSQLKTKLYNKAKDNMEYLTKVLPNKSFLYEELAKISSHMDNKLYMHENLAIAYILDDKEQEARIQIELAKKYSKSETQTEYLGKKLEAFKLRK